MVVGLGRLGVCLTGISPALPRPGDDGGVIDLAAVDLSVAPGVGVAVRTAVALGCAGRVAGTVANDALGRFVRGQLSEGGLDVGELRPWGAASPTRVIAIEKGPHRLVLDHAGLEPESPPPSLDPAS